VSHRAFRSLHPGHCNHRTNQPATYCYEEDKSFQPVASKLPTSQTQQTSTAPPMVSLPTHDAHPTHYSQKPKHSRSSLLSSLHDSFVPHHHQHCENTPGGHTNCYRNRRRQALWWPVGLGDACWMRRCHASCNRILRRGWGIYTNGGERTWGRCYWLRGRCWTLGW